jgi:hypothetical protein
MSDTKGTLTGLQVKAAVAQIEGAAQRKLDEIGARADSATEAERDAVLRQREKDLRAVYARQSTMRGIPHVDPPSRSRSWAARHAEEAGQQSKLTGDQGPSDIPDESEE